jgi:hypothetical protein
VRELLGFVKDLLLAIKGSIAVRARRIPPRTRLALVTVALLPVLLLTTAYVVGLDGKDTRSDISAPNSPHSVAWPDRSATEDGTGAEDGSAEASAAEPGSAEGTDPAGSDSGDDPSSPGGPGGDEPIASGPLPEASTPQPWPGGDIQNKSVPSSVEGSAPAAPAPGSPATTSPPATSTPNTTGPSTTTTTTTTPPSGDPPPDEGESGLLGSVTDGLLDTVTGLL